MKKRLINIEPVRDIVRDKLIEKYNAITYINTEDINIKLDIKDLLNEYIESKSLTPPTIYISANAYVKMRMLVDQMSTEVGWYGTVTKCPGLQETYVIEDILVRKIFTFVPISLMFNRLDAILLVSIEFTLEARAISLSTFVTLLDTISKDISFITL